ncbi:uncharacterized protein LOC133170538 [Syngnathus typhle]|uniref:uncharacterized protein LOC133170538 n=1 Tax=Syngnathus typhle TaxID=161592 RepID=UPI002A6A5CCE|nr:uncharacterized protein LOC133170538 [Syngnathus typhle]
MMKTGIVFYFLALWLLEVNADVIFVELVEKQSVELSCPLQQECGKLTTLHLYHRRGSAQRTLLSLGPGVKVDPGYKSRLNLSGGCNSSALKVNLSHLKQSDSGMYVCENPDDGLSATQLFLLVKASESCCSSLCPPLLMAIFSATVLIFILLLCFALRDCVKADRPPPTGPAAVPIYEEMSRKEENSGVPPNNALEEELTSPLHANTLLRQSEENYYACPRHIKLKA